jgi:hypothetical protein
VAADAGDDPGVPGVAGVPGVSDGAPVTPPGVKLNAGRPGSGKLGRTWAGSPLGDTTDGSAAQLTSHAATILIPTGAIRGQSHRTDPLAFRLPTLAARRQTTDLSPIATIHLLNFPKDRVEESGANENHFFEYGARSEERAPPYWASAFLAAIRAFISSSTVEGR